jgi:hypothetical protein
MSSDGSPVRGSSGDRDAEQETGVASAAPEDARRTIDEDNRDDGGSEHHDAEDGEARCSSVESSENGVRPHAAWSSEARGLHVSRVRRDPSADRADKRGREE